MRAYWNPRKRAQPFHVRLSEDEALALWAFAQVYSGGPVPIADKLSHTLGRSLDEWVYSTETEDVPDPAADSGN